jgi:hypothetical protein
MVQLLHISRWRRALNVASLCNGDFFYGNFGLNPVCELAGPDIEAEHPGTSQIFVGLPPGGHRELIAATR